LTRRDHVFDEQKTWPEKVCRQKNADWHTQDAANA